MMWHLYASGKINQCTELGCKENTMHFSTRSEAARYYRGFKEKHSVSSDSIDILGDTLNQINKIESALSYTYEEDRFIFLQNKLRDVVSKYNKIATENGVKTLFWEEDEVNVAEIIRKIDLGTIQIDDLKLFPVLDSLSQKYATKLELEAEVLEIDEAVATHEKTLKAKEKALKAHEKKNGRDPKNVEWVALNGLVVRLSKRLDNVRYGATKLKMQIDELGEVNEELVLQEAHDFINNANVSVTLENKRLALLSGR